MTNENVMVYGPAASVEMSLRVDTGARNTIIPASVAARLGLPNLGQASVATYGQDVRWVDSKAYVALPGTQPVEVPVWIAPDGAVPALGATAMTALGYRLVRPVQNFEPTSASGPYAGAAQPDPENLGYFNRLEICRSCPSMTPGLVNRCSLCGCPTATKALFPNGCPEGRF